MDSRSDRAGARLQPGEDPILLDRLAGELREQHGLADTAQAVENRWLGRPASLDAPEGDVPLGELVVTAHEDSRATSGAR